MPNVVSVVIKCNLLSAVEARSSWEGVSPSKVSTETCNTFAIEGNVEICFGYEGAKAVPSEGKKMVNRKFGSYRAWSNSPHRLDQSFRSAK